MKQASEEARYTAKDSFIRGLRYLLRERRSSSIVCHPSCNRGCTPVRKCRGCNPNPESYPPRPCRSSSLPVPAGLFQISLLYRFVICAGRLPSRCSTIQGFARSSSYASCKNVRCRNTLPNTVLPPYATDRCSDTPRRR